MLQKCHRDDLFQKATVVFVTNTYCSPPTW